MSNFLWSIRRTLRSSGHSSSAWPRALTLVLCLALVGYSASGLSHQLLEHDLEQHEPSLESCDTCLYESQFAPPYFQVASAVNGDTYACGIERVFNLVQSHTQYSIRAPPLFS